MITQEELKELLEYNPDTGVFTRKKSTGGMLKGSTAGYVHHSGYIHMKIKRRCYMAHRLAWLYITGAFPSGQIDHIDRVTSNNSWSNLRDVSQSLNQKNKDFQSNNTSGITGVTWHSRDNKWYARVSINNKRKHLGYFDSLSDAVLARKRAMKEEGNYIFKEEDYDIRSKVR